MKQKGEKEVAVASPFLKKERNQSNKLSELDDFLLNNSPFGSIGGNQNQGTEYLNSKDPTPKDKNETNHDGGETIKNINKQIEATNKDSNQAAFNQKLSVDMINQESEEKIKLHKDISFSNKVLDKEKTEDPKE